MLPRPLNVLSNNKVVRNGFEGKNKVINKKIGKIIKVLRQLGLLAKNGIKI
jgi:hypothetical protein